MLNAPRVALHAILGLILLMSTVLFTYLVALYFGHDVLAGHRMDILQWLLSNPTNVILAATAAASAGLVCRVLQTVIEARVVTERERWFAERLRSDNRTPTVTGNIPRASNYYGRLASSSMKAVSTIAILAVNLVAIIFLLPNSTSVVVLGGLGVTATVLFIAMRYLAAAMGRSATNLTANAKAASNWKVTPDQSIDAPVEAYFRAYFFRIFLASSFSFAAPLFGIVFCLAIIALREVVRVDFSFAQAFVMFAMMQSYVALLGRLFGAFVHGAAFIPAVRPYLDPTAINDGDRVVEVANDDLD